MHYYLMVVMVVLHNDTTNFINTVLYYITVTLLLMIKVTEVVGSSYDILTNILTNWTITLVLYSSKTTYIPT